MELKWRLSQAHGYLGLGMVDEAAAELDRVPIEQAHESAVLALRVLVLHAKADWPSLMEVARTLVVRQPGEDGWWITWAYATRRARSLSAAEEILLRAEHTHPRGATIQFNLGCYACQRGDLIEARRRVERAIALDKSFREIAATDPDLEPLRAAEGNARSTGGTAI